MSADASTTEPTRGPEPTSAPEPLVLGNDHAALRSYWHPVGRVDTFAAGPRRIVLGGTALVVAVVQGEVVAFADECPHRSARLSDGKVVSGDLQCPYHGWRFGSHGGCTLVPALGPGAAVGKGADISPIRLKVAYGLVFVALDEPRLDVLDVPEWGAAGFTPVWLPEVVVSCGAAQFADNFLDTAHFPFVHAGTFGSEADEIVPDYVVERSADRVAMRYEHVIDNHEDPATKTGEAPLTQKRIMEFEFTLPFGARVRIEYPEWGDGVVNTIVALATPTDETSTTLHQVLLRNDITSQEMAEGARDYELRILAEDVRILEHLPGTALPLGLTAQMHTRADKITLELRRLLAAAIAPRSTSVSITP